MASALSCLLSVCWLLGQPAPGEHATSYLFQPAYSVDDEPRFPAEPYVPQPGDIIFTSDSKWYWAIGFALACTGPPHHATLVIARPDGRLAMLEAGPHDEPHVAILDLMPNLREYEPHERIWVRRRRTPLTPEQSARLTAFALAQENKPFAVFRLVLQVTPLRARGPIRTWFVGGPHGNRDNYFCSELVMEACVDAGLLDRATARPSATYPRDIFFDHSLDPYLEKHLNLTEGWYPPARWCTAPWEKHTETSSARAGHP
jgi:hypothetical protein